MAPSNSKSSKPTCAETAHASADAGTVALTRLTLAPTEPENEGISRHHQAECMLQLQTGRLRDAFRRSKAEAHRWKLVVKKQQEHLESSNENKTNPPTLEEMLAEIIDERRKTGDPKDLEFLHDIVEEHLSGQEGPEHFPFFFIMKARGVEIPHCFDRGLLYSGDAVMDKMPTPETLPAWIDDNKDKLSPTTNDKVVIKPSLLKGKGLYAAMPIKKGELVGHYGGILRVKDETHDSDSSSDLKNDQNLVIDAQYCGGPTRYINSPDEAVGEKANVVASIVGKTKIRITAKDDIEVGDELLMNYVVWA